MWNHPRHRLLALGTAAVVVAALLAWALWPDEPAAGPPRARQYLNFTACLLTDQQGVRGPEAAPVWAGMQDASNNTRAKVQYLEVTGEQTAPNAATFLSSLAQGTCNVIFAAGGPQVQATVTNAPTFPKARFYVVGKPLQAPAAGPGQVPAKNPKNVTTIDEPTPENVRATVAKTVTTAVGDRHQ